MPGLLVAAGAAVREVVSAERLATLAALHEEWIAVVAALRQERIAILAEVEALEKRAIESATVRLRALVGYTLWRVAALLAFLMLLAATLGLAFHRLAAGRLG